MGKYVVRVVLHEATWQDYDELHEAMRVQNFSQVITSKTGLVYELPPAEYYAENDSRNLDQILASATRAAKITGKKYGIVASECVAVAWAGLEPVATGLLASAAQPTNALTGRLDKALMQPINALAALAKQKS